MKMLLLALLSFDLLGLMALCALQQREAERPSDADNQTAITSLCAVEVPIGSAVTARPAAGIQWFATWESGLAEAQRINRPILLVAAAPHCAGVSGMW